MKKKMIGANRGKSRSALKVRLKPHRELAKHPYELPKRKPANRRWAWITTHDSGKGKAVWFF